MSFDLSDLSTNEKCYLVFKGTPSPAWFDHGDAERYAQELCEEPGDKATIIIIPKACLEIGLVAVNHGVVIHALSTIDDEED